MGELLHNVGPRTPIHSHTYISLHWLKWQLRLVQLHDFQSRSFHSLPLCNVRRWEHKYDKEHMSLCLTGWPSGREKDSTTGGTHLADLVLWQISLKMGVCLQYITMLDRSLVAQNDSTHLFHYLLEKMTLCPEVYVSYSMNKTFKQSKGLHNKNAHLIFNWVTWAASQSPFSPNFSSHFFDGGTKHDPGLLMAVLVINCAEHYLLVNMTACCYLETSN